MRLYSASIGTNYRDVQMTAYDVAEESRMSHCKPVCNTNIPLSA